MEMTCGLHRQRISKDRKTGHNSLIIRINNMELAAAQGLQEGLATHQEFRRVPTRCTKP